MTEQVSPLRQRMIEDMAIRNMSPNTQNAYIRGGAFPFSERPMRRVNPRGSLTCQRGAKMLSEAQLSGCSFFSVWCCFLAGWFIGSDRSILGRLRSIQKLPIAFKNTSSTSSSATPLKSTAITPGQ